MIFIPSRQIASAIEPKRVSVLNMHMALRFDMYGPGRQVIEDGLVTIW